MAVGERVWDHLPNESESQPTKIRAMNLQVAHGALFISIGSRFSTHDVDRLRDALAAFRPCTKMALHFLETAEVDDAALHALARMLVDWSGEELVLTGLTPRQQRIVQDPGIVG